MGKTETAIASLGIKIVLSDLVLQMNDTNATFIRNMLEDGFIEDDNDYLNETYQRVIDVEHMDKEYLLQSCKENGLFDQTLLVPIKEIVSTSRWGYDRYGTHGISRPLDFDLSVMQDIPIEKYSVVFILKQHSG